MTTNLYADNIWLSNLSNDFELPKVGCLLGGLLYRGTRWKKGYCHYTTEKMAEYLGVSLRSITYAIKALRERGYIEVFRMPGRRNNCYRLLSAKDARKNTQTSKDKQKRQAHITRYEQELRPKEESKFLRSYMRKNLRTIDLEEKMLLRNTSLPERADRQEGEASEAGGAVAPLPPLRHAPSACGGLDGTNSISTRQTDFETETETEQERETSPVIESTRAVQETHQAAETERDTIPAVPAEPPSRRKRGRPPGSAPRTVGYLLPREPSDYKEWRDLCEGLWKDKNPVQRPRWLSRAKWRGFTDLRFMEMLTKLSDFMNRGFGHDWCGRDHADKKLLDWVNNEKHPDFGPNDVKLGRRMVNSVDYINNAYDGDTDEFIY